MTAFGLDIILILAVSWSCVLLFFTLLVIHEYASRPCRLCKTYCSKRRVKSARCSHYQ